MRKLGMAAAIVLLGGLRALGAEWAAPWGGETDPPIRHWEAPPYWRQPEAATGREALAGRTALAGTPTPLPFVAIAPCRVADTRGNGFTGVYGPPSVGGGTARTFTITGACGIPADAQAVSFNFTVWNTLSYGNLAVYPAGGVAPVVSTLNWNPGVLALANAAVVPLGTGGNAGQITVVNQSGNTIDVFFDVNGYYSPQGVVNKLNGLTGDVTLAAGTNVTLTPSGNTLTIAAAGGGGGGGTVTSVGTGAGLTGGPITASGTVSVAPLGITTGMLANNAVTGAKLAAGAVGLSQIDTAQVQARVTSACPAGSTIRTINADGSAVCTVTPSLTGVSITTLDSGGTVGQSTSITTGADGLGLISYWDSTNGDLKVAHCSNVNCTSATVTTLDSLGTVGAYTSITTGADGLGLISYSDGTNQDLKVAHCSNVNCASATVTTLDSAGNVGQYTSIATGADGLGLISYYNATNFDLKVAHCSNVNCTSATVTTLDSAGSVGAYTAITTGADGLGLISYNDGTNADLKVAHCSNLNCTSATVTTLDSAGAVGYYTSITTGADGLGLISYYDATIGDLKVAHCSNLNCTSATVTTLDGAGDVGSHTSITTGADGLGLISYHDATNGILKAAHCSNANCTSATVTTLDSAGYVGQFTSITTVAGGLGLISYYDLTNGNLKVAPTGAGIAGAVTLAGVGGTTVTQSGNTLTITSPAGWGLTGNSGTSPGANFIGTTDGQPLEIRAAGGVGIGTTFPSSGLDVVGRSTSEGTALFSPHASKGSSASHVHYGPNGDWYIRSASTSGNVVLQDAGGSVAIGTADPQGFKLAVDGEAAKPGGGSWSTYSDARLKRDVRPLEGALDRLLALRGVSFEYLDPAAIHELPGTRIGMVAQEVEQVFPDWVSEGRDGYRHLTFRGFEALAVEALRDMRREKDAEIAALKAAIEAQARRISELEALFVRASR